MTVNSVRAMESHTLLPPTEPMAWSSHEWGRRRLAAGPRRRTPCRARGDGRGTSRGFTPGSGQRRGSRKSGRCSMTSSGGWNSSMMSWSSGRPHTAASARWCVSWRRAASAWVPDSHRRWGRLVAMEWWTLPEGTRRVPTTSPLLPRGDRFRKFFWARL